LLPTFEVKSFKLNRFLNCTNIITNNLFISHDSFRIVLKLLFSDL
jgi:hypothetical protein